MNYVASRSQSEDRHKKRTKRRQSNAMSQKEDDSMYVSVFQLGVCSVFRAGVTSFQSGSGAATSEGHHARFSCVSLENATLHVS